MRTEDEWRVVELRRCPLVLARTATPPGATFWMATNLLAQNRGATLYAVRTFTPEGVHTGVYTEAGAYVPGDTWPPPAGVCHWWWWAVQVKVERAITRTLAQPGWGNLVGDYLDMHQLARGPEPVPHVWVVEQVEEPDLVGSPHARRLPVASVRWGEVLDAPHRVTYTRMALASEVARRCPECGGLDGTGDSPVGLCEWCEGQRQRAEQARRRPGGDLPFVFDRV